MHTRARHRGGGFTLTEALLSAVVLAAAVSAAIYPFVTGAQHELHNARQTLAASLAQEMMEEILTAQFPPDDKGGKKPKTRDEFTRMDHYDGLVETGSDIRSYDGRSMDLLEGLGREVSVQLVYLAGQDTSAPPDFLRVTVVMKYDGDELCRLNRLVYAYPTGRAN